MATTKDNVDDFFRLADEYDPVMLWAVLRTRVLSNVPIWDMIFDKADQAHNLPLEKVRMVLDETNQFLHEVEQLLQACCHGVVVDQSANDLSDKLVLSDKLSRLFGQDSGQQVFKLKSQEDIPLQYYSRLYGDNSEPIKTELKDMVEVKIEEDTKGDIEPSTKRKKPSTTIMACKQCDKCKRTFNCHKSFNFHKKSKRCSDIPEPPKWYGKVGSKFFCTHPDCGAGDGIKRDGQPVFNSRGIFWRHLMDNHITDNDLKFHCDKCPKRFPYLSMLTHHMSQVHIMKYFCKYCGKGFPYNGSSYHDHIRTHTGEKPFKCDRCDFRVSIKNRLKYHYASAHGDTSVELPQHVCEICGRCFHNAPNLREHVYTHTDIKRFTCPLCGRQLRNDSCYRRHMVGVHKQKFTCELCARDFSSSRGLKRHEYKDHQINNGLYITDPSKIDTDPTSSSVPL